MPVNWASPENAISIACIIINALLLIYNIHREVFIKSDYDTLQKRLLNLSPNAKLCLISLFVSLAYFFCSLGSYSFGTSDSTCLQWQMASDVSIDIRTCLLMMYYTMRLRAVYPKMKNAVTVILVTVCIGQWVSWWLFIAGRQGTFIQSESMVDRACVFTYNPEHWIFYFYLTLIVLPILVCNVIFTAKLISVMRALPNSTSGLSYLKNSSGGIDLLNIAMAIFSIVASAMADVPGSPQVSNLLLTFIFHFALVAVNKSKASATISRSGKSTLHQGMASAGTAKLATPQVAAPSSKV